ncbi:MAG: hypothetical protein HYV62_04985, partial [Candidatus Rokubacteria bacterium]|nr:hypothetical protein [Candidatus Rokubacteria bacterium]
MTSRRRLARFLRQFRRPTLGRVLALSVAVHLIALVFLFRSDLITGTP